MLKDTSEIAAKHSLDVMIELYRKKIWFVLNFFLKILQIFLFLKLYLLLRLIIIINNHYCIIIIISILLLLLLLLLLFFFFFFF